MPSKRKVFISHAHEDSELCRPLVEALRNWNLEVWIDVDILKGGDEISDTISKAISDSEAFIRVCTQAASKSRYMSDELTYFADLRDDDCRKQGVTNHRLVSLHMQDGYKKHLREGDAKYISTFPLFAGFFIAPFTRRKQALHDMVAGTVVTRR